MDTEVLQPGDRVLFVPHYHSSFLEMQPIAIRLQERFQVKPVFLIHWQDCKTTVNACHLNGIEYCLYGAAKQDKGQTVTGFGGLRSLRALAKPILRRSSTAWLLAQIVHLYFVKRRMHALLASIRPACILLMGDRHIGVETALVRLANDKSIPSLIVPFGLSDPAGAIALRQSCQGWQSAYGMGSRLNRLVTHFKPKWSYAQDSLTILWQPAARMLAAVLLQIMPTNPWTLGGGQSWYMAVESEHVRKSFEQQGVPSEKLIVTGKPRYDRAAELWQDQESARRRICAELGLEPERPLLLCAVPQLAEHKLLSWPEHWREIEFLFASLAQAHSDVNVVLSLHPKSDAVQYVPLADKYDLLIAHNHGFEQLVPICDLFVATYSSTVTLAIACHKPAIVIDFYGLGYDLFDELPGTVVMHNKAELLPVLQRLLGDEAYYKSLAVSQAEAARTWACFDGQATERIVSLVTDLVAQGRLTQKLTRRQRRKALPLWSR